MYGSPACSCTVLGICHHLGRHVPDLLCHVCHIVFAGLFRFQRFLIFQQSPGAFLVSEEVENLSCVFCVLYNFKPNVGCHGISISQSEAKDPFNSLLIGQAQIAWVNKPRNSHLETRSDLTYT